MSGVNPTPCEDCGKPFTPSHNVAAPGPTVRHPFRSRWGHVPTGGQEREGEPATGVASVDTLRDTATLTRLRDATRRRDVAAHEVATEMTRAFAEGFSPAEIDAAMRVRWPGVPT